MAAEQAGPLVSRDELANIAIAVSADNDREPDPLHVGMIITALIVLWRQYEAKIVTLIAELEDELERNESLHTDLVLHRAAVEAADEEIKQLRAERNELQKRLAEAGMTKP